MQMPCFGIFRFGTAVAVTRSVRMQGKEVRHEKLKQRQARNLCRVYMGGFGFRNKLKRRPVD